HPGLIPTVRGLDAFKWAIYDKKPLGITLHFIDKEVDAGEHIFSMRTPVFASDTLESLSLRHYMNELHILINYKKHLKNRNKPLFPKNVGKAHMRMSAEKEKTMLNTFPEYIYEFSKQKRELS
ncbi:MAG: hypothetical protein KAJ75_06205, partial [Alphaproteobacteria bacterium]|nr:hypothetical protein [Alphaproteobacteria bacterium]